ncbi:MAG: hypothetical protein RL595_51 [Planctomycetota bacterium]
MDMRDYTPSQEVNEKVQMIRQYAEEYGIEIIGMYGDYKKRHMAHQRFSFQSILTGKPMPRKARSAWKSFHDDESKWVFFMQSLP